VFQRQLALPSATRDGTSIGHVVVGMERQGYSLSLTKITDDGWRATFHSNPQLSADGFATDAKPWRAVQLAAWEALKTSAGIPTHHGDDAIHKDAAADARDGSGDQRSRMERGGNRAAGGLAAYLRPLELPRREASDVNMELVESGIVAVARELDLKFHLVVRDGYPADRTGGADAGPSPCAGRGTGGQLAVSDRFSGFLAKDRLVRHLAVSEPRSGPWQWKDSHKARCQGARRRIAPTIEPGGRHPKTTTEIKMMHYRWATLNSGPFDDSAILVSVSIVSLPRITPAIPTLVEPFHRNGWVYEEKIDGWRIVAYKRGGDVRLISRTGREHTASFPDIARAIGKLSARTLILDGRGCGV